MRLRLLRLAGISAALIALTVAFAHAQTPSGELNMAWTNCYADAGTLNKTFACNSNTGSSTLVLSFTAPSAPAVDSLTGAEAFLDLVSQSSPLPQWWSMFNQGTCRTSSLTGNTAIPGSAVVCQDAWSGLGVGGVIGYDIGVLSGDPIGDALPNINSSNIAQVAVIDCAAAVPSQSPQQIVAGTEYFLFNVKITNAGTVGTTCTGCSDPVCLSFSHLHISQPVGNGDWWVTTPGPSMSGANMVTWQGTGANCSIVPVKAKSWGALKSMYR